MQLLPGLMGATVVVFTVAVELAVREIPVPSKLRTLESLMVTLVAPLAPMGLPVPQKPPVPLLILWFLATTSLRDPDDPESNMIPVRFAEQLLSELVPSTPILVRVTPVPLMVICVYAPENVLFGIVTT